MPKTYTFNSQMKSALLSDMHLHVYLHLVKDMSLSQQTKKSRGSGTCAMPTQARFQVHRSQCNSPLQCSAPQASASPLAVLRKQVELKIHTSLKPHTGEGHSNATEGCRTGGCFIAALSAMAVFRRISQACPRRVQPPTQRSHGAGEKCHIVKVQREVRISERGWRAHRKVRAATSLSKRSSGSGSPVW